MSTHQHTAVTGAHAQMFDAARERIAQAERVSEAVAGLDEVTVELLRVPQLTDSERYRLAALLVRARVLLGDPQHKEG